MLAHHFSRRAASSNCQRSDRPADRDRPRLLSAARQGERFPVADPACRPASSRGRRTTRLPEGDVRRHRRRSRRSAIAGLPNLAARARDRCEPSAAARKNAAWTAIRAAHAGRAHSLPALSEEAAAGTARLALQGASDGRAAVTANQLEHRDGVGSAGRAISTCSSSISSACCMTAPSPIRARWRRSAAEARRQAGRAALQFRQARAPQCERAARLGFRPNLGLGSSVVPARSRGDLPEMSAASARLLPQAQSCLLFAATTTARRSTASACSADRGRRGCRTGADHRQRGRALSLDALSRLLEPAAARGVPCYLHQSRQDHADGGRPALRRRAASRELYESLGGSVTWIGKPYPPIFDAALALRRRPGPQQRRLRRRQRRARHRRRNWCRRGDRAGLVRNIGGHP